MISPPTWGWPATLSPPQLQVADFPTHVGMARQLFSCWRNYIRFPHPRGDGPQRRTSGTVKNWISPPTWGWPEIKSEFRTVFLDFPTHVGMARYIQAADENGNRFPHPRGDGPGITHALLKPGEISPPTWGWPVVGGFRPPLAKDFPTHVGMARAAAICVGVAARFPHPRGDGPRFLRVAGVWAGISPPTWGWPARGVQLWGAMTDFPTHVGMARSWQPRPIHRQRFPHPRGDGPICSASMPWPWRISPPTWGWPAGQGSRPPRRFDFPTHVGMARRRRACRAPACRFPHPRGDGPSAEANHRNLQAISPPTWGWPDLRTARNLTRGDFPTHVGMARNSSPTASPWN